MVLDKTIKDEIDSHYNSVKNKGQELLNKLMTIPLQNIVKLFTTAIATIDITKQLNNINNSIKDIIYKININIIGDEIQNLKTICDNYITNANNEYNKVTNLVLDDKVKQNLKNNFDNIKSKGKELSDKLDELNNAFGAIKFFDDLFKNISDLFNKLSLTTITTLKTSCDNYITQANNKYNDVKNLVINDTVKQQINSKYNIVKIKGKELSDKLDDLLKVSDAITFFKNLFKNISDLFGNLFNSLSLDIVNNLRNNCQHYINQANNKYDEVKNLVLDKSFKDELDSNYNSLKNKGNDFFYKLNDLTNVFNAITLFNDLFNNISNLFKNLSPSNISNSINKGKDYLKNAENKYNEVKNLVLDNNSIKNDLTNKYNDIKSKVDNIINWRPW